MSEIKLHPRYPNSRTEDIVDAHMRGFAAGYEFAEDEIKDLREMCRDLYILRFEHQVDWKLSMDTYEKYDPCDLCYREHGGKSPCASTAEDMSEECCDPYQATIVAEKLRELGVEVPE